MELTQYNMIKIIKWHKINNLLKTVINLLEIILGILCLCFLLVIYSCIKLMSSDSTWACLFSNKCYMISPLHLSIINVMVGIFSNCVMLSFELPHPGICFSIIWLSGFSKVICHFPKWIWKYYANQWHGYPLNFVCVSVDDLIFKKEIFYSYHPVIKVILAKIILSVR